MSERRVYELAYPELAVILRNATNKKKKIEKSDREEWKAYVKKHNVPEAVLMYRGKSATLSGKVEAVIVEGMGKSDGYFVFSSDEQFCLKFESGLE